MRHVYIALIVLLTAIVLIFKFQNLTSVAVVDAGDSRLYAGHGDGKRPVWPGSELDPRRHTAAALIEAKIVCVAVCPFATLPGVMLTRNFAGVFEVF
jgi:hypothetical protein